MGGRRRRGGRPGLRRGRRRRRAGHDLPALPSGAAGDLRHDRRHEPGDGSARPLQRQPGAERPPDRVLAGRGPAGAHDPDHDQRHRRRVRQQGAGLPRLRVRDRGHDPHRQAGQVGRGPLGEPDVHGLRPRLHHERQDLREGRQDHRRPGRRDRRPRRLRLDRAAVEVPRRLLPRLRRLLRPRGRPLQRQGRLHEQGPRRGRLPVLVPGHRGDLPRRAAGGRARAEDGGRPGRAADGQLHPARAVPVREQDRLDLRLGQLPGDDARGDADRRLRRPAPRAGGASASGAS